MRAKLNMHHKLLIAMAAAVTMLLLLAVGVWAYDNAQKEKIAPGVTVGGVDIGGRDVDSARKVIENEIVAPLKQPVVVTYAGEEYTLTPKRLEQSSDVEGMLDEAVEESRDGGLVERVSRYASGSEVDVDIEPRVGYSEDAVAKFVARMAGEINRDAVNASLTPSGDSLSPEPGDKGFELQEDQTQDLIIDQVETPGRDGPVDAVVKKTEPEVTQDELAEAYPTYLTIDRGSFTLRLFKNLKLKQKYTIAVGAVGYDTPSGLYDIQTKEVDPTWHVPDSDWTGDLAGQSIPPGPGNPLKARWMGIYDGAGIHGTDDVGSIGTAASHGCIRMTIPDVVELFDKVEVGDPVYIL
jgi:L,D-transpeptidase catalytic domain/Putative peptidoglycan binding domain